MKQRGLRRRGSVAARQVLRPFYVPAILSLEVVEYLGAGQDWVEYQRLCQSESPDFIVDLPDYYAFFTRSMFQGKAAK